MAKTGWRVSTGRLMQPSKKIMTVYRYIRRYPGSRKNTICRKFGIKSPDSFLIGFEVAGLYLYEDDEGRLFIAERSLEP